MKPNRTKKPKPSILLVSKDWELRMDLVIQLIFLEHIVKTTLRPDLIFFSNKLKSIVI